MQLILTEVILVFLVSHCPGRGAIIICCFFIAEERQWHHHHHHRARAKTPLVQPLLFLAQRSLPFPVIIFFPSPSYFSLLNIFHVKVRIECRLLAPRQVLLLCALSLRRSLSLSLSLSLLLIFNTCSCYPPQYNSSLSQKENAPTTRVPDSFFLFSTFCYTFFFTAFNKNLAHSNNNNNSNAAKSWQCKRHKKMNCIF